MHQFGTFEWKLCSATTYLVRSKKVLQKHPEYKSNTDEYGVDLVPRDAHSQLRCIELMVYTSWYGSKRLPKTIFIRKRKRRHMHAGTEFWIFSVGLKKYAFIRGEALATVVAQLPLCSNPHNPDDKGYTVPIQEFAVRQL